MKKQNARAVLRLVIATLKLAKDIYFVVQLLLWLLG